MPGIGIISNPRSRRNRRSPHAVERLRALLGADDVLAMTPDAAALEAAAHDFLARDIDVLALNGGDGTNHVTLTVFRRVWGDRPLPAIALLCGGTMNTVARGLGVRGKPDDLLRRIVQDRAEGRTTARVTRPLLIVTADGSTSCGFIVGNGIVFNFLSEYYAYGEVSPAVAAGLLARSVASVLTGGVLAQRLFQPFRAEIHADGVPWTSGEFVAVMASNQSELGLGFRPFARCDERPDAFHAVAIAGSHGDVLRALPAIRLARPLGACRGFDERVCSTLSFTSDRPIGYTIDGDIYTTDGPLVVEAGPSVSMLVP